MTTSPAVEARSLYQAYGRQPALRGVELRLARGEAVALLGPNGAGKSTLLRILSTLERPQRGEVRYGGSIADERTRSTIGLVAHESLCYGDLSARENLVFFGGIYGVKDPAARAAALIERVALGAAADRPARTYSRGMLQRLAVARALVHGPRLLLLDEPVTGLDRQGVSLLASLLAEEKAAGASLIIVSHELAPIAPLVDRALVLRRGRIVRDESLPPDAALATLERVYAEALAEASDNPSTLAASDFAAPGAA